MKHATIKNLTPAELGKSVLRRPGWFLVPVLLGLVGAFLALRMLTPIYRASTQVLVEPQKVPADYVKPTVTTDIDERLKTLEQQITNRSHIERIIQEMNLYPELRRELAMEKLVDQVRRKDLTVERRGDIFSIGFKSQDPKKAAATANRIAELFIQENLKLRENQAQGTSSFLSAELQQAKEKLEQQEARVAVFKQLHMGQLPEQRDTNLQQVGQLQDKLEINMDALDRAETRKILLQSQVAEARRQAQMPRQPVQPTILMTTPGAPSRLDQLRAELIDLRSRFTDRHPDVIRLQNQIAQLERAASEAPPPAPPPQTMASREPEPVRIDPELLAQLQSVDYEIRNLHAERGRILADISRVQARLEEIPRVEQELLSLTRDYENKQRTYESLLEKQSQARLAENLEKRRQSEQFTILEKAVPPAEPFFPNPLYVLAAGLAAGALAGILLSLLRDQTDSTYADGDALQQAFPGVRVLATIPIFSAEAVAGSATAQSRFRRN
ncbi:MAG TPA: GNVR domain-containing protein [Thermoanaerobaculia bacterium]|nr:GNVR domain-containing protein [Thermoanaerobaculia bacterium]